MKKIIAIALMFLLLLSMASCGKEPTQNTNDTNPNNSPIQNNQTESTTSTESTSFGNEDVNSENWGVSVRWTAGKSGANSWEAKPFYVNFPKYAGYTEGNGLVAEQLDDTFVVVAAEYKDSPAINALDDFMPAYSDDLIYTLESVFGIMSENFQFQVETEKTVTVGSYSMQTFVGIFSFEDDGQYQERQYVLYATQLKSNDAYAYWLVYDTSENQSNGNLIAEHALNMAKTFREEQ